MENIFLLHSFCSSGVYSIIITYLHIFVYERASNSDVSISFHARILSNKLSFSYFDQ